MQVCNQVARKRSSMYARSSLMERAKKSLRSELLPFEGGRIPMEAAPFRIPHVPADKDLACSLVILPDDPFLLLSFS